MFLVIKCLSGVQGHWTLPRSDPSLPMQYFWKVVSGLCLVISRAGTLVLPREFCVLFEQFWLYEHAFAQGAQTDFSVLCLPVW